MINTELNTFIQQYTKTNAGFYIDIGAYDGSLISNTAYLDQSGWRGVCCEPHDAAFGLLLHNRPKALCLPYAISDHNGTDMFLSISGYSEMLSGLIGEYDPRHKNRIEQEMRQHNQTSRQYQVQTRTLSYIFDMFNRTHVDYISIDAEGAEVSILQGFNWKTHSFSLLTLEDNFNENIGHDILSANGYRRVGRVGIDNCWARI